MFARVTFLISGMFLVVTSLADAFSEVKRYHITGRIGHVVGTAIALGLWRLMSSRRSLSPTALQWLDLAGTISICWSFAMLGHYTVQPYGWYTGLLAMTHVSISRAMMVPSVPRRTLILAIASFGALVVSRFTLPLDYGGVVVAASLRTRGVVEALLWGTAGTAVATLASIVIYGLHEKALEARQLGQYALEHKIGQGGMGEVYRAHDTRLERDVAVKVLPEAMARDTDALARFDREMKAVAALNHPNILSIHDVGDASGRMFAVTELLEGETLLSLIHI